MNLISRDELKAKIDAGDDFKLVMVLSEWAFKAKRIPGSMNIDNITEASSMLDRDDEIVIYCSDETCPSSKYAYQQLVSGGYSNVRRYAGGISDWEDAGMPMEGDWA